MGGEQVIVVRRHLDASAVLRALAGLDCLVLDLAALTDVDLGVVDCLARLHLAATRAGVTLRLHNVPRSLTELLELAGLTRALDG